MQINYNEVYYVVTIIMNNMSGGEDDIIRAMIKINCDDMILVLSILCNYDVDDKRVHMQCKNGIVRRFKTKKCNGRDINHYLGITLLSVVGKIIRVFCITI